MSASAFVIPSIFTAVDKFTSPLKGMSRGVEAFASKTDMVLGKGERLFRKMVPGLGDIQKQFLNIASTAAIVAGIIGGISFSVKSVMDYEKSLASLSSITGVVGKAFIPFKAQVLSVAKDTSKSAIEVAKAFEIVGSAKAELLENADALGMVTKAAITLSKASGDDLAASAANVTGVMNQFSLGAEEANRVINVLAAGSKVGAANISQVNESMTNFGAVAAGANISVEQSVALVEVMGQKSLFGAEAGTKLRGSILKLQQAGVGYKSGQFQINDALEEAKKKIDNLKTAKQKDAAVLKMFGAENITTGKILLDNINTFKEFTTGVTGTSIAQQQAAINSDTLSNRLDELKNAWVNMLVGSDSATSGMNKAKNAVKFVTDNLDTFVTVGIRVIEFFVAWKAIMFATRAGLLVYNVAIGVYNALTKTSTVYTAAQTAASSAQAVTTGILTTAQWSLNAAMNANPIGLIVLAIAALIAGIMAVINHYKLLEEIYNKASAAAKVTAIQKETKAVNDLSAAYQKQGMAKEQADKMATQQEVTKLGKVQNVLAKQAIADQKALAETVSTPWGAISEFFGGDEKTKNLHTSMGALGAATEAKKQLLNPQAAAQAGLVQSLESTNNAKVDISIKDQTGKADVKNSGENFLNVKTTSTLTN